MRRFLPLLLLASGIVLLAASTGWGVVTSAVGNPTSVALPERIAGLVRSRYTTGRQAVAEFGDLHGEDFPLISGAVGVYGNNQVTIWAAGAPMSFLASRLVSAMHAKIAEGQSPFMEVEPLQDRHRTVYALNGMGQNHYYFQSKNLVIWLAAEPALADEALRQTLEAYP